MLFQLFLERLLYPVLDTALFRIGVLPIATEDRERRVRTFSGEKQRRLTGGVSAADDQRPLLSPTDTSRENGRTLSEVFARNIQASRIIHRTDREEHVPSFVGRLVGCDDNEVSDLIGSRGIFPCLSVCSVV